MVPTLYEALPSSGAVLACNNTFLKHIPTDIYLVTFLRHTPIDIWLREAAQSALHAVLKPEIELAVKRSSIEESTSS